jgi:ribosomal protein S18 acetylase RimI-like enzyme
MRSKGVGSTLMERVEHQAALDGKELTLEVWTVNQRAAGLGFYGRRGFSIDGKTDGSNDRPREAPHAEGAVSGGGPALSG